MYKKIGVLIAVNLFSPILCAEGLINYTPPQMESVKTNHVGGGTRSLTEPQIPVAEKPAIKHKGKGKQAVMTEVTEECIIDKATGREFCQVVSELPVITEQAAIEAEPKKSKKKASKIAKEPVQEQEETSTTVSTSTETTEECLVDKSTGQERCQTVVKTVSTNSTQGVDIPSEPNLQKVESVNPMIATAPIGIRSTGEQAISAQKFLESNQSNQNVSSDSRVALVIGNSNYAKVAALSNPAHDADDMATELRKIGFDVVKYNDVKIRQIGSILSEFRNKLKPGSAALVFYAGHGLQVKGENYFPVVDADIQTEEDIPNQSISLKQITNILEDSKTRLNLVFLDACRNNPYARAGFRSMEGGLAKISAPSGTLISYATRPGSIAADGDGRNGLYTSKLLKHLKSEREIELTLKDVLSEVKSSSNGKQEPWVEGAIEGNFCFGGCEKK